MIATAPPLPMLGTMAGFRRFTVNEYHWLISLGFLTEDDDLELIEGYLIHKMARNPRHDRTNQRSNRKLLTTLPGGWDLRIQSAITLIESEPEPDISVVRGDDSMYDRNHPTPPNIGAVMEISDSSLPGDRTDKGRIYARAGNPFFGLSISSIGKSKSTRSHLARPRCQGMRRLRSTSQRTRSH